MYNVELIADSKVLETNSRITTVKVTYPRIVHSEFLRHRMLSRNTASSRAIPFDKLVKDVMENPFIPIAWQKAHKGMQGSEYLSTEYDYNGYHAQYAWLEARNQAVRLAKDLNKLDVTKQLCNRLLEPFVWTTELITATDWNNFFELRCPKYVNRDAMRIYKSKKDFMLEDDRRMYSEFTDLDWLMINESPAEIHIQKIAEMIWDAYKESSPRLLNVGDWHIPYGDKIEIKYKYTPEEELRYRLKIATARCARISYETFSGSKKIDHTSDIRLHGDLLRDRHFSPMEHCARAMTRDEFWGYTKNVAQVGYCDNFKGFISYRYTLDHSFTFRHENN